jgi:hypothetical protein
VFVQATGAIPSSLAQGQSGTHPKFGLGKSHTSSKQNVQRKKVGRASFVNEGVESINAEKKISRSSKILISKEAARRKLGEIGKYSLSSPWAVRCDQNATLQRLGPVAHDTRLDPTIASDASFPPPKPTRREAIYRSGKP